MLVCMSSFVCQRALLTRHLSLVGSRIGSSFLARLPRTHFCCLGDEDAKIQGTCTFIGALGSSSPLSLLARCSCSLHKLVAALTITRIAN
eukprot:scaffold240857_cov30-Tisochrysis_lutea.AAC.1